MVDWRLVHTSRGVKRLAINEGWREIPCMMCVLNAVALGSSVRWHSVSSRWKPVGLESQLDPDVSAVDSTESNITTTSSVLTLHLSFTTPAPVCTYNCQLVDATQINCFVNQTYIQCPFTSSRTTISQSQQQLAKFSSPLQLAWYHRKYTLRLVKKTSNISTTKLLYSSIVLFMHTPRINGRIAKQIEKVN